MIKQKVLALPLLCLLVTVACLHKSGGTTPTVWERVTSDNALLAESNNTVEQGAELAFSNGLLDKQTAGKVIGFTGTVASAHLQITAVLAKGVNATSADYDSIQTLLQGIKDAGDELVKSGDLGIKNPKSQETIKADVDAVVGLAAAIISQIPALRQNPSPGSVPVPPTTSPTSSTTNNHYYPVIDLTREAAVI